MLCVSSADPGVAADRGHHGLGPGHGHHQAGQPPLARGVLHPRLGLYCTVLRCTVIMYCTAGRRPHLVRDQAALGRRPQGCR